MKEKGVGGKKTNQQRREILMSTWVCINSTAHMGRGPQCAFTSASGLEASEARCPEGRCRCSLLGFLCTSRGLRGLRYSEGGGRGAVDGYNSASDLVRWGGGGLDVALDGLGSRHEAVSALAVEHGLWEEWRDARY